jgi:NADH dehydrogenase
MQGGLYAGHRIRRAAEGRDSAKPFRYHDLGSAAYIARGNAVMSAGPLRMSGLPGWIGWLFIHIAFLTGYRNRLGAVLTWWSAFTRDRRRERAFTAREVGRVADLYTAVIPVARTGEPAALAPGQPATPGQPAAPGGPAHAPRRPGA